MRNATETVPAFWPNAQFSKTQKINDISWHYQDFGAGPTLLFLHGAGGSTHSWSGVASILSTEFRVVSVDLPGQGFSRIRRRDQFGLKAMSRHLGDFLAALDLEPHALIGHSAGAVIALQLSGELDAAVPVLCLNGAFNPFEGLAGLLFPTMARILHHAPFAAAMIARSMGSEGQIRNILNSTGSHVNQDMVRSYLELVRREAHIAGTLGMMAQWNLADLTLGSRSRVLHHLLLTGAQDRTVPPATSTNFAHRIPTVQSQMLPGLGHLAQEEAATEIARVVADWLHALGHHEPTER